MSNAQAEGSIWGAQLLAQDVLDQVQSAKPVQHLHTQHRLD